MAGSRKIPKHLGYIILAVIVVLLVGTQAERYTRQGTILGYQVRKMPTTSPVSRFKDMKAQPSKACDTVSEKEVKEVLRVEVQRIGGNFPDRTTPTFSSSCSYRTTQKPYRVVSITIHDAINEASAKTSMINAAKRPGKEVIRNVGSEALFFAPQGQLLVRSGKRTVTIMVNKSGENQVSSKDAALKLVKQVL